MVDTYSRHLNSVALKSLERIGDLYIPGTDKMPSFSQVGCLEYVDVVLDEIDPDDLQLLAILLLALRWMPSPVIELLMSMMDRHHQYPEPVAGLLRLISLALKGVTMSLYYSGLQSEPSQESRVHGAMGYHLHCEPDNQD